MANEKPVTITNQPEPKPDSKTVAIYSNYAAVFSASEEFIIRFCQKSLDDGERPVELARIYLTLSHAKRLMMAMARTIEQYETLFGQINIEPRLTPEGEKLVAGEGKEQDDANN